MPILLLLKSYWKPLSIVLAVLLVFNAGYQFRAMQDKATEAKEIKQEVKAGNEASTALETTTQAIQKQTDNLNQQLKVTYAEIGNRCPIPASGLRILKEASR